MSEYTQMGNDSIREFTVKYPVSEQDLGEGAKGIIRFSPTEEPFIDRRDAGLAFFLNVSFPFGVNPALAKKLGPSMGTYYSAETFYDQTRFLGAPKSSLYLGENAQQYPHFYQDFKDGTTYSVTGEAVSKESRFGGWAERALSRYPSIFGKKEKKEPVVVVKGVDGMCSVFINAVVASPVNKKATQGLRNKFSVWVNEEAQVYHGIKWEDFQKSDDGPGFLLTFV